MKEDTSNLPRRRGDIGLIEKGQFEYEETN
jgi:hypothetical protein